MWFELEACPDVRIMQSWKVRASYPVSHVPGSNLTSALPTLYDKIEILSIVSWEKEEVLLRQQTALDPHPKKSSDRSYALKGRGGGLVDRAADSGPHNQSLTPLGEKKEN